MERFLLRHAAEIAAEGCSVNPDDILHPIHDQVWQLATMAPSYTLTCLGVPCSGVRLHALTL